MMTTDQRLGILFQLYQSLLVVVLAPLLTGWVNQQGCNEIAPIAYSSRQSLRALMQAQFQLCSRYVRFGVQFYHCHGG
jgi:hypothetical protein